MNTREPVLIGGLLEDEGVAIADALYNGLAGNGPRNHIVKRLHLWEKEVRALLQDLRPDEEIFNLLIIGEFERIRDLQNLRIQVEEVLRANIDLVRAR